jgi:glycosyltransferase involved in cell wall biosynthesis
MSSGDRLKVIVLGVRGLPNVQGGVETHAEHLYQRMAELGCDVEVIVRSPFVPREVRNLGAIRITRIWSPTYPGLEALLHSLLAVIYAGVRRPDILHIHAVGPCIVAPIARLFGLRVVMTHHGPDYDRDKWGWFARTLLRTGERFGARYSHVRIAISKVIADLIKTRYGEESELIPNGVVAAERQEGSEHVRRFGLDPGRYFLQVGRLVPEKRQLDLIRAYERAQPTDWKLALVGGLSEDSYSREVRSAANKAGAVLTGFLKGVALRQMYTHAGGFVLPSSHEGLPIALLEALSYGLPVLASDIPPNLEIGLEPRRYFPLGDISALADALTAMALQREDENVRRTRREWVECKYDWQLIAEQTAAVYRRTMRRG